MDKKYIYNLLVIDDEIGVTKTIFRQFHKEYNVFTANSAKEAIAIMEKENIQIVITDQRMPGMTGLDFLGLIKEKYPGVVKIMLSGYSDIEAVIGAINEGQVFRYITKPWNPEELSKLLREATWKYELITKNKRLEEYIERYDVQLKEILNVQKQTLAAEEKLKAGEEKFRALFADSPIPTYTWQYIDNDFELREYNSAALKITNGKVAEIIGIKASDMYREDERVLQDFKKCFEQKSTIAREMDYTFKTNSEFKYLNVKFTYVFPDRVMVHTEDFTKRKQAEDTLKASEESYVSLFNSVSEAIYLQNEEGTFINVNEGAVRMYGLSREEFIGKTPEMVSAPNKNDLVQVNALLKRVYKTGNPETFDFWGKRKSGEIFPKEVIATRIKYFGKDIILSSARDISDRKQMEAELLHAKEKAEESEKRLNLVIKGSNDAPWDWDLINNEMFYSPQWWQQIGYKPNEILSDSSLWEKIMHPDDKSNVDKNFGNALKNGQESYAVEFRLKHKNGYYVPVLSRGFITFDENKKPIRVSGTNLDLTKRKKIEFELINAKEKAEESDRLKSAFLANMSHEIRTPMNGILGFTNLLKEPGLSGEEQQQYISIIEKSGVRMLNTINDIVDISKIEAGQVDVVISDINLNKQIDELLDFFLPEAKKKNINLSITNRIPDQQAKIKSDKDKLNSILTNLIKNAIKYTHAGSIEFGVSTSSTTKLKADSGPVVTGQGRSDELEFYVKDTGIGIAKERQKAVFDRFVQADIEDKQVFQGSGLGLAISKAYVEMLGGKIWVESTEGFGSQFNFTLPCNPDANNNPLNNIEDSSIKQTAKKELKCLIVDDEELIIAYLQTVLKKYMKEILVAKTGIDAVEMCRNNPDIDIVLMDIRIPGINGYEATRQIREFNKEVFILAQTAYAQMGDREKCIEAGCDEYIAKPIKKEKLLEIIDEHFK